MKIDDLMKSYVTIPRSKYLSLLDILCKNDGCTTITPNGAPMNFDKGHLSHEGAMYIIQQIEKSIFDR